MHNVVIVAEVVAVIIKAFLLPIPTTLLPV
jgi:hypothetical protein